MYKMVLFKQVDKCRFKTMECLNISEDTLQRLLECILSSKLVRTAQKGCLANKLARLETDGLTFMGLNEIYGVLYWKAANKAPVVATRKGRSC
jgi:hypothetical protein